VFRPNSTPTLTYVRRTRDYEQELRDALASGSVVSLTGPSKSGKTVLATKVVEPARACYVNCSTTSKSADFWREVLRKLGGASQRETEESAQETEEAETTVGGGANALVVSGKVEHTTRKEMGKGTSSRVVYDATVGSAIDSLVDSHRSLIIDDFHYLASVTQRIIARQVKGAAFRGVPVVILSVPYRGDDPVLRVPDLVGRVARVGLEPWNEDELVTISEAGFPALNASIDPAAANSLARESIRSPQLMQLLCLETCYAKGLRTRSEIPRSVSLTGVELAGITSRAAAAIDYSSILQALSAGPRKRHERTIYQLINGTEGDLYRVALASLSIDPIKTSIDYEELKQRTARVCASDKRPIGRAIQGALEWMSNKARSISRQLKPQQEPVLEWRSIPSVLELPDPYFTFYLRWREFPGLAAPG